MARAKVMYEPERELLTVFWQAPRPTQIGTELDDGIVSIKDETTGEPIGRRRTQPYVVQFLVVLAGIRS